ncbi:hypothetical protein DSO57_1030934 [Entomophthora muscae]|uniref:Uncharacterized protein n=1 Tax=Entomophthora muscae TaxID=34485 RepID=A0ACC2T0M7_9FUNG|nr:hypothetical protein DSO57_1030934 [Entomophthora muscae]
MSSSNSPREAESSPSNSLDLLKAITTQNIPFFDGTNLLTWPNCFELYCKKHRVKQADRIEEVQFFLEGRAAAWHSSLTGNYTWANWKSAAFKHFDGGIETVIAKLKGVEQTNFKTTEEFIEESNTLLNQYQDLVYGSYSTLEGKRACQTFLENQGLDWVCETLTPCCKLDCINRLIKCFNQVSQLACQHILQYTGGAQ